MVKIKIPGESREERFKRLATVRTRKVLNAIRVLGNCSNRNLYTYNPEETNKIFSTIQKELKITKAKFEKTQNNHFSLK